MLQTKYVQRLQTDHILACNDGEIGIFSYTPKLHLRLLIGAE